MTQGRRWCLTVAILAVLSSGCAAPADSSAPTVARVAETPGASSFSKFDLFNQLQPLAMSVVRYTDSDYGTDVASGGAFSLAQANLGEIDRRELEWRSYLTTVDVAAIAGLESAVSTYNSALDRWQSAQARGLDNWESCMAQGGTDLEVSGCMLSGYSIADEMVVLDDYTTALRGLLEVLGVTMDRQ